jgi:hypothetical protein
MDIALPNQDDQIEIQGIPWAVADVGPEKGVTFRARGDLLRYGWQQVNGIEVPERFVAIFVVRGNYAVELLITVEDGSAGFDAVKITRIEGRPRLRYEVVRHPYDAWVDYACARVFDLLFEQRKDDEELVEQAKMIKARRNQDRQVITGEFLDEIAEIYQTAKYGDRIEAIRRRYPKAKDSTVRRWVERAREEGKLPPTGRPKRRNS